MMYNMQYCWHKYCWHNAKDARIHVAQLHLTACLLALTGRAPAVLLLLLLLPAGIKQPIGQPYSWPKLIQVSSQNLPAAPSAV
jgi:hypothetical protein